MKRIVCAIVVMIATCTFGAEPATQPALDQAALEQRFAETMTGAELVGRWASFERPDAVPKEDRYTIESARKIPFSDRWLLTARVKNMLVPLTIPVKWAGDTPVISVTDMSIPRMGTYTARVMIYGTHYAGTWSAADHGGHLWGRIERAGPTTAPTTKPGE